MSPPAIKPRHLPKSAATPEAAWPHLPAWLIATLLALVTVAAYWSALQHDFVNYDDDLYVTSNAQVQKGLSLSNMGWAFLNPVNSNWHPLTVLSHMTDCQLFGLNPWGHHLTSVLLHALNAALIFLFLRGLTSATWPSMFVAALFALHPLHVESVAWVAERKDVLSTCFGLSSLIFYVRYAQVRSQKSDVPSPNSRSTLHASPSYLVSLLFLALGLMSKAMLVTWPCVMLLLDWRPLERFKPGRAWRLLAEKIPFFALAAAISVVTFVVQKQEHTVKTVEEYPWATRGANALISYCRYLGKMVWPSDLAVFYPHPGHWPVGMVLLAGLVMVAISLLLFYQRRRHPLLLMGWLWYCGTLVPVIQLVQTGGHAMADRYTYIPSVGALIVVVWGACEFSQRWRYGLRISSVAGALALIACLALTRHQLEYWRNSETLFRHASEVTANNFVAHDNLGTVLGETDRLDEAILHFREAIRLKPTHANAHCNLGLALDKKGQPDQALLELKEALRLKPDYAEAHYNLGIVLDKRGRMDEAMSQFREAIRLKPGHAAAHNDLGVNLGKRGQLDAAIGELRECIRLKPNYPEAHNNLGTAFLHQGRTADAIAEYREALRLKPGYADARNNLASALANPPRSP